MKTPEDVIRSFGGQMVRDGAQIIMIFKVKGKYYPATQYNRELMDNYMHTGDPELLNKFEDEKEL